MSIGKKRKTKFAWDILFKIRFTVVQTAKVYLYSVKYK